MPVRLIQFIFVCIPFGLFFWLARMELVPDGVFQVRHSVQDTSPYIDALSPSDRVRNKEGIVDDPVFFFLHPHRNFDRVFFEIWFQNTTVPIIEFGGLMQTKPEGYDLRPLHNLLIDRLTWPKMSDQGLTLYQKVKRYDSFEAFYADPPARDKVAVYKADYQAPFRLSGYVPSSQERVIETTLRGQHEFKTYVKNETLDFRFEFMDMNRDEGADFVAVTLFDERGQPVAEARTRDDGDARGDAMASEMRQVELQVPGLSEGVYKIVMNASRDIFFRKIKTTQSKIVFLNRLYLGDEIAYRAQTRSVELWTASKQIRAQTRHAEGVQDLTRGERTFSVSEPYETYTFETDGKFAPIVIPKGDVEIYVDSPLSFFNDQYFQPDPLIVRPSVDFEQQGIEYVLTSYKTPNKTGDWLVQTVEFETAPLVFEKKSWKFIFSLPTIRERNGEMLIKEMNLTMIRPPFSWDELWKLWRERIRWDEFFSRGLTDGPRKIRPIDLSHLSP